MGAPKRRRSRLARTVRLTILMAWSADPGSFCLMIGLALVPAAIPPVVVVMGKHLVDLVAEAHFRGTSASALVPTVVALGVLTALQRGLNSILASRQELFARRVYLEAERGFLAQAATVDLGHFDDSDWHDRVARASRDVSHRPANLTWTAINVGGNLVTSIGMLGILASLNPLLVALVAFSVVPNVLIQKRMTARLYAFWWDETPEDRERVYLGELLHLPRTAKELRSFHLGPHLEDRHNRLGLRQYERMRRLYRAYEATSLIISVVSGLTIALAYGLVADRGVAGQLTAGDLTAVIAAFAALSQQISLISSSMALLDQNAAFLEDYFAFLAVPPLLEVRADPIPLPAGLEAGIRFSDVHFRYPGSDEKALQGFELWIRPGELVALVGENGAGKTSVVKLLMRFYDPDGGSVSLGGVDLRHCDPVELRSRIGVLFQDYATYELSARENILFGRAGVPADEIQVWNAIEAARAAPVIKGLRQGLDSKVGRLFDGGHDLSGGEWQRLALARLLYRDADVWILDEPTSSLDPEAEAAIFAELRENLRGRMGIVISHRFSTVRIADRIAVVSDGRIAELGTHEELIGLGGRYARLFELQAAAYR